MSVMVSLVMAASIMATPVLNMTGSDHWPVPRQAPVMICKAWAHYGTIYMNNKNSRLLLYIYFLLQFFDLGRGLVGYKFADNLSQKRYISENGKITFEISNYPQHLRENIYESRFVKISYKVYF